MALTLTFDPAGKVIAEPGYHQTVWSSQLVERGAPNGSDVQKLWAEPRLGTLMLRPLQFDPSWLDTSQQTTSVIRLSQLQTNASDISAGNIFEQPVDNNANPWVWHVGVGPSGGFPTGAPHPFPGSPPSLVGITPTGEISDINVTQVTSHDIYQPLTSVPVTGSEPAPTSAGGWADRKTVAETALRLPENAGLFLRWWHPTSRNAGWKGKYVFYIGQFALLIQDVWVEIWEDTSPNGDRTQGRKVEAFSLFTLGDPITGATTKHNNRNGGYPFSGPGHERSLLWLPYRRNQVLLVSSYDQCRSFATRPASQVKRNADNTQWVNVREDTVRFTCLTPQFGRFQLQRVKFPASGIVDGPIAAPDYSPAIAPALTLTYDADGGSTVTGVRSQPPSYSAPTDLGNDVPNPGTPPNWQVKQYGVEVTLTSSSDRRQTPVFYRYELDAPRVLTDSTITPVTVSDVTSGTNPKVIDARFSTGRRPGEGRGTVEILDPSPYALGNIYYRSQVPVKLVSGGTVTLFSGLTEPMELTPLKKTSLAAPRRLTVPMVDNWARLTRTYTKDLRDWQGEGHITAVLSMVQLAGIDTAAAETPPLTAQYNTPLGGSATINALASNIIPPWRVKPGETIGAWIQRVADHYSNWEVGFRLDGTFFYLPKNYYDGVTSVVFYEDVAAATAGGNPTAPRFRAPVSFTTVEPEANVIMVVAGTDKDASRVFSSVFVDWASIKNVNAANYLGFWKPEIIEVGEGFTTAQLNWVARKIWDRTRRRFRNVEFEADHVPTVKVGTRVTLHGYGDYRVTAISAYYQKGAYAPSTFSGELIENGF